MALLCSGLHREKWQRFQKFALADGVPTDDRAP